MARLLNAILDISRFDAARCAPSAATSRSPRCSSACGQIHAEAAADKGLVLRVARTRAVVETDPVLLYRILGNLVSNAVRYTRARRRAGSDAATRRRGGHRGLGHGPRYRREPAARDLPRVRAGRESASRPRAGLGLGLAIVERTARLLGHGVALALAARTRDRSFGLTVCRGDPARVRPLAGAAEGRPLSRLLGRW
jgi:K+-sensing histidine kinase KdpD